MTAATLTHQPAASIRPDARLSFARILHSEWVKMTSLRSTVWSLGLIIVVGIGLSFMITAFSASIDGIPPSEPAAVLMTLTVGVGFGQLIAAVLGVLVMSGEYSTGMIRSTLAAVPTRLPVLAAKAIVLFVLVTLVGAVTVFGSWAATYPILESQGAAVSLGNSEFTLALVAAAVYLGLTAVFALGLGTLLRSAAGGIAAALGIILVIDSVVPLLSLAFEWVNDVVPYLYSSAGAAMFTMPVTDESAMFSIEGQLEPWVGGLVVVGWTLLSLAVGAARLQRQDA